jgi:hypothetical protein
LKKVSTHMFRYTSSYARYVLTALSVVGCGINLAN